MNDLVSNFCQFLRGLLLYGRHWGRALEKKLVGTILGIPSLLLRYESLETSSPPYPSVPLTLSLETEKLHVLTALSLLSSDTRLRVGSIVLFPSGTRKGLKGVISRLNEHEADVLPYGERGILDASPPLLSVSLTDLQVVAFEIGEQRAKRIFSKIYDAVELLLRTPYTTSFGSRIKTLTVQVGFSHYTHRRQALRSLSSYIRVQEILCTTSLYAYLIGFAKHPTPPLPPLPPYRSGEVTTQNYDYNRE